MRLRMTIFAAVAAGLLMLIGPSSFATTRNAAERTRTGGFATVTQNLESVAGVSFVDTRRGYVLLSNYRSTAGITSSLQLYSTSDGGASWRRVSLVGSSVAWGEGTSIWQDLLVFANVSDGLIFLNTRQLLISHDAGRVWRSVTAPGTVVGAVADEQNFVLAVGNGCGESCSKVHLMVLPDNGYTIKKWSDSPVGALQLGTQPEPLLAWTQATLYSSREGAEKWTRRNVRLCRDANVLFASIGASDLWLVCDEVFGVGDNPKWVYRSMNGGKSWNLVARVDGRDRLHPIGDIQEVGRVDSLIVLSASRAVMVKQGDISSTSDGGKDWVSTGLFGWPNGGLICIGFLDCWAGWASASTNPVTNAMSSQPAILRTTNAGQTWKASVIR